MMIKHTESALNFKRRVSFWQALWDIFKTVSTFITNYFILSTITTFPIGYNVQNRTAKLLCKAAASSSLPSSSSSSSHHHHMILKASSPSSHHTHIISISIVIIIIIINIINLRMHQVDLSSAKAVSTSYSSQCNQSEKWWWLTE